MTQHRNPLTGAFPGRFEQGFELPGRAINCQRVSARRRRTQRIHSRYKNTMPYCKDLLATEHLFGDPE